MPSWYTLLLPARTPSNIAERLRAELKRVAANAEFTSQLASQAIDVQFLAPGQYTTFLKGELAKWAGIVRTNHLRPE